MSNMEITFDPKWEAACAGLALGEDHERWPDGEWIHYARRLTGIEDLFVYYHRRAKSWVLAKWLFPPTSTDSPVALELEAMPLPPDMPESGRLVGDSLLARCRPVDETVDAMRRKLRQANEARMSTLDERAHSKRNAVKYMRRKGMDEAAARLERGQESWVAPGETNEQYRETVSELMAMTKAV